MRCMPHYQESSAEWQRSVRSCECLCKTAEEFRPARRGKHIAIVLPIEMIEIPGIPLGMRHDRKHVAFAIGQRSATECRAIWRRRRIGCPVAMRIHKRHVAACTDFIEMLRGCREAT